jgi:hypothetical protein
MLITSLIYLLLSNAITLKRDKSILHSRVAIIVLLYTSLLALFSLYLTYLDRCSGLYGNLFNIFAYTQICVVLVLILYCINKINSNIRGLCVKLFIIFAKKVSPYIEKFFLDTILYLKINSAIVRCLLEAWDTFSMTINLYLSFKEYTTKDIHLIKFKVSSILIYILAYVYFIYGIWTLIIIIIFIIIPSLVIIYLLFLNHNLQKTNPKLNLAIIILASIILMFGLGFLLIKGIPGFGMASGSGNNPGGDPGGNGKLPPYDKPLSVGKDKKRRWKHEEDEEYDKGWTKDYFKKTKKYKSSEKSKLENWKKSCLEYRDNYNKYKAKEFNGTLTEEDSKKIDQDINSMKRKVYRWTTDNEDVAEKIKNYKE